MGLRRPLETRAGEKRIVIPVIEMDFISRYSGLGRREGFEKKYWRFWAGPGDYRRHANELEAQQQS